MVWTLCWYCFAHWFVIVVAQLPSNPNISTRDALRRAQQLLGTKEADVRIFYDPKQS